MRFEWDPAKSERNRHERGFDFEFATLVFDRPILVSEDLRRDYGERRFRALGVAISVRLAAQRERRRYDEAIARAG